jgi:hypothetical protein
MSINIHTKYLKYKKKYLELKNKMNGGGFNDPDTHLDNGEPVYELTNGYIINTFKVSTDEETALTLNLTDTPAINCIYRTANSNIVFIPKIKGLGLLHRDADRLQTFLLSKQKRGIRYPLQFSQQNPLPAEIIGRVRNILENPDAKTTYQQPFYNIEMGTVHNNYIYGLEYKSVLPPIISMTKMKSLIDSNDIDVAFNLDINSPHIYYIFSDEEFRNNKTSFINLLHITEAEAKRLFDRVKYHLLNYSFDIRYHTIEAESILSLEDDIRGIPFEAVGSLYQTPIGDGQDDYDN